MSRSASKEAGLFSSVAAAFRRFQARRSRLVEWSALSDSESQRVAHDVGLSEAELAALSRYDEHAADLMEERLACCGVDGKAMDQAALRDMQRCCTQCDSKDLCAQDMESRSRDAADQDLKPKVASWPPYCPNQQTVVALMAMKCH